MQNEFEQIRVEFANKAKDILFLSLEEFDFAVKKLNRNSEEYKFNHIKEQHVQSLKQRLIGAAREYIERNQNHRQIRELDQIMQEAIKGCLHQFVLRTRSI